MVHNNPAKFGNHTHCGSEDIIFLVVEEEGFYILLLQFITRGK